MSEHRIAWTLHNFEMEQTIIRLRNTRNRLLERIEELEEWNIDAIEYGTQREAMLIKLEHDNASIADRLSGAELERNNGKFPGAEAIETYRNEIRRLERENASLADRLSGAELERDRLGAELEAMKLYVSYLEDNMTPEALRFAQAGFDIEKAKIKIAG